MTLFQISFRNFLRQRRRNILLGIAIAFGVMVLTVTNAFSRGISDNLLNRVVIYMTGHVRVNVMEKGRFMSPIVRNPELIKRVQTATTGLIRIQDDVSTYARAVGNGKSDYVYMVGLKVDPEFKGQFSILSGSFANFEHATAPNPVLLSEAKAKALNVKVGDSIGLRLLNVNGQNETAILTVAAILKSQNVFMDYAVFLPISRLKSVMGYETWESGAIKVILKDPKTAKVQADKVQTALTPPPAYWTGNAQRTPSSGPAVKVTVAALAQSPTVSELQKAVILPSAWTPTEGVVISTELAKQLNVGPGDSIDLTYPQAFRSEPATLSIPVAIVSPYTNMSASLILMPEEPFFSQFNHCYPKLDSPLSLRDLIPSSNSITNQIAGQWMLTARTQGSKGMTAEMKELMKYKQTQPVISVSSMYESAAEIVKIEQVFNLATLIAGAILFSVIMIGVLNSLRMTIRERTQEIGTLRAIGMRAKDVQRMFMLEVFFLATAGWIAGLVASAIAIAGLSLIKFGIDNPFNMMMVNRHLYFVPTLADTIKNLALLMIFALSTAYFPARSAAKLPPAEAFRHVN